MSAARPATVVALRLVAVAAALIVVGNLAIMAASWWARATTSTPEVPTVPGVDNLQAVDERLWRGAAPTPAGYRGLAAEGVTTVVDLRAEDDAATDGSHVERLGMRYVHVPIRDGQVPRDEQVEAFLRTVEGAPGRVFVHCGAGVGRTGAMAGAYLVADAHESRRLALRRNLAVGPPSLEQLAFVAGLDGKGDVADRPGTMVTATSRVLDFPRRAWHVLGL